MSSNQQRKFETNQFCTNGGVGQLIPGTVERTDRQEQNHIPPTTDKRRLTTDIHHSDKKLTILVFYATLKFCFIELNPFESFCARQYPCTQILKTELFKHHCM